MSARRRQPPRQLSPEPNIVTPEDVRRLAGRLRWRVESETDREKAASRQRRRRREETA